MHKLLCLLFIVSCSHPIKSLHDEFKKYGHIPYINPLKFAGPGTLLAGSPSNLHLVAPPKTCFPDTIDGIPTQLRSTDYTVLPKRDYSFEITVKNKVSLFNQFAAVNPSLRAKMEMNQLESFSIEMRNVTVEYFDSVKLTEFYRNSIHSLCKEYLQKTAFVIQAIRVGELRFEFSKKNEGKIKLDVDNIKQFLDIGVDLRWKVEDQTQLVVESPHYFAYQLGKFEGNGMILYRASKVVQNKFHFEPISLPETGSNTLFPHAPLNFYLLPEEIPPISSQYGKKSRPN